MAMERLIRERPAVTETWRVAYLELSVDGGFVTVRFRSDAGRDVTKQVTGAQFDAVITRLNATDNTVVSAQEWLLENAMALWPEDFGGGTLTEEER